MFGMATITLGIGPHFQFGEGELGPHQCGLGRGLPPYKVSSRFIQPFGHNRYGPKIGGYAPLGKGSWVPI